MTLLWTQTSPTRSSCKLDDEDYVMIRSGVRWQVLVWKRGQLLFESDRFESPMDAAVWADGFAAEADKGPAERYNAGYEAIRRWDWLGRLWQAPQTQPCETLD